MNTLTVSAAVFWLMTRCILLMVRRCSRRYGATHLTKRVPIKPLEESAKIPGFTVGEVASRLATLSSQ
jgi:hypothetical protein